jgi:hypothetical protein
MMIRNDPRSFDEFFDIIAEVPVLLEESDLLISNTNNTNTHWRAAVLRGFFSVIDKIYAWQNLSCPSFHAVPSRLHNPADDPFPDKAFPFSLEFDSLETAAQFCLSWAVTLQILGKVAELYQHFWGENEPERSLTELVSNNGINCPKLKYDSLSSIQTEAYKISRNLCQSIPFCHRVEMGMYGPQSTCYVQWTLRKFFEQHGYERELQWVLNIKNMRGPGHRCGIQLMTFD